MAEAPDKSVTELGKEFKLPDISSPWLTKVFPISVHPTDNFESEQWSILPPTELFDLSPTVGNMEREVAPIPVPDTTRLHRRLQNLSEQQQVIDSLAFDGSVLDDASSDTEGGSWRGKRIAAEWRTGEYRVDFNEERSGERQISE